MNLASRLKIARIKAGLTQKQLAELCGVSQAYIAKIENGGIKKLQEQNFKKISKIVEI